MQQLGAGQQVGPNTREHRAWTPLARALAATGDHWTLMIVVALAPGRMRLTNLHRRLPGVSTGVLERYLQQMLAAGLVTRTRFREMPPRVELELTDTGRELLVIAGMLARWGMRNRWSDPGERERIDIGALLYMLPILLDGHPGLPEGTMVEALVGGPRGLVGVLYRVEDGRLEIVGTVEDETILLPAHSTSAPTESVSWLLGESEGAAAEVAMSLRGHEQAWIAALGPAGDYSRLRLDGDVRVATELLDALPRLEAVSP
jgi:DNA-binding HxlR family transcriptional regulator